MAHSRLGLLAWCAQYIKSAGRISSGLPSLRNQSGSIAREGSRRHESVDVHAKPSRRGAIFRPREERLAAATGEREAPFAASAWSPTTSISNSYSRKRAATASTSSSVGVSSSCQQANSSGDGAPPHIENGPQPRVLTGLLERGSGSDELLSRAFLPSLRDVDSTAGPLFQPSEPAASSHKNATSERKKIAFDNVDERPRQFRIADFRRSSSREEALTRRISLSATSRPERMLRACARIPGQAIYVRYSQAWVPQCARSPA